jgi:hypothetical protein
MKSGSCDSCRSWNGCGAHLCWVTPNKAGRPGERCSGVLLRTNPRILLLRWHWPRRLRLRTCNDDADQCLCLALGSVCTCNHMLLCRSITQSCVQTYSINPSSVTIARLSG